MQGLVLAPRAQAAAVPLSGTYTEVYIDGATRLCPRFRLALLRQWESLRFALCTVSVRVDCGK